MKQRKLQLPVIDCTMACDRLIRVLPLGRQYREAGQISQQIKSLTQQLEEEQQKMSMLEAQLSSHTAQLLSLNQQVANTEAKIVSLQKEKGNVSM